MFGRIAMELLFACAAAGGGSDGGADCSYDTTFDPGMAECRRDGICGGAGGGVLIRGIFLVGSGQSVDCCFTEHVIPPHHELIRGDQVILEDEIVRGYTIHRRCDAPITVLGLSFGSWSCVEESRTQGPKYHVYTLGPCPGEGDDEPPPDDGGDDAGS